MKIAICIPCYALAEARFVECLANMVARPIGHEIVTLVQDRLTIERARTYLVQRALEAGAGAILFMDADHTFPPDTLARLLAHELPVVALNYAKRQSPTGPTALGLDGKPLWTTRAMVQAGSVEEVSGIGLGVCLIKNEVFAKIDRHAKLAGESAKPLFHVEPDGFWFTSEDHFFFRKVRAAGVKVFVDHALSWECGHIGPHEYTLADAERDREEYQRRRK